VRQSGSWPAEDHPRFAARVIVAGALGLLFTPASLLFHSGGVFIIPIATDTGWSQATIASAVASTSFVLGLMSPLTGYLVDQFKPRRVSMVAMPCLGVGLILLGLVPHSARAFFATMMVAAVLAAGQMPHAYTLSVASWFERRRGLALGTILSFTGVGLALFAPLAAALIGHLGWRMTYVVLGASVAVLGFAVAATLVADPPEAGKSAGEAPGLTCREAIGTRRFWLFAAAFLLIAASIGAGTVHLPVILAGRGASPAVAASALTAVGITTIATRFAFGYFLDRIFAPLLTAIVSLVLAFAHLALIVGDNVTALWGAVMLGVALGAEVDALAYLVARAFGFRSFGRIFGLLFTAVGLGGAAGPALVAQLARTGHYTTALAYAAAAALAAAVLIALVRGSDLAFTRH
jgi:OFA family oxalate/formate antiporter-like MFS transporter